MNPAVIGAIEFVVKASGMAPDPRVEGRLHAFHSHSANSLLGTDYALSTRDEGEDAQERSKIQGRRARVRRWEVCIPNFHRGQ